MKFSYKFSNLVGTVYRGGNLLFTPDGNSVISPVGNRLSIFDLKNNKAQTLAIESEYNYTTTAISPDGSQLVAVNDVGAAYLISMVSCRVVHRHKFVRKVQSVVFSPDGAHFAVALENRLFVFRAPGELTGEYNPFVLVRNYIGGYDDITWLDWSSDSRFIAIGCRDSTTKVCGLHAITNFRTYILGGHSNGIVGCFFEENNLHLNTLSRDGQLCIWECNTALSELTEYTPAKSRRLPTKRKKQNKDSSDEDSGDEEEITDERETPQENLMEKEAVDVNEIKDEAKKEIHPFRYKKITRHYLANEPRKEVRNAICTAAHYNRKTKIMVIAFSSGAFYLYELPDVNMIHSLSISDFAISAALFNTAGDWVALASRELGQLLVWEWQSEQYVMKQQGHTSEMTCMSYSPDGVYIATGGEDSKVKLWNTRTGFCFVTFSEHTSGITGVQFSRNKKFLVSSSLDGTVRAFDITRYRNFRTFTSPRQVQFACVGVDFAGELVAAGGQDVFEIYLWSIKLGSLLEVISSHEGPVTTLAFSPSPTSSTLVSGSWDKTIKIWNCLELNSEHETIDVLSEVSCVIFKPNGDHVAVATLSGNISVFDVKTATQITTIEGRNDLVSGRSETDLITAKRNKLGKFFTSIEYSVDGDCILAGGNSNAICIYHVEEAILLKKFLITQNRSLDGINEFIDKRYLTEFGNMALVEKREENEGGNVRLRLPGVQKGDMAARRHKPEMKVYGLGFSPTGQAFATACTEGLCIYSLDKGIVFDPFNLSLEVTPKAIKEALKEEEYSKALIMALKLNESNLILYVLEKVPFKNIELICSGLPNEFANRLLQKVANILQSSPHIEFYLEWCCCLLTSHGNKDGVFQHHSLLALHESMSHKYEMLHKICDFNKYTMRVLLEVAEERKKFSQSTSANTASSQKGTAGDGSDDEEMLLIPVRRDDQTANVLEFADETESSDEE